MRCSRASPLCQYASWGVAMTSRTHRPTSATSRRVDPQRLVELRQALGGLSNDASDSKTVNVGELQAALLATLPRIIAVNWEPESGKHQLDAAVANVLARLKSQSTASALKRAVDASKAVSRAGTSVQGKKYQPSNQVAPCGCAHPRENGPEGTGSCVRQEQNRELLYKDKDTGKTPVGVFPVTTTQTCYLDKRESVKDALRIVTFFGQI